MARKWGGIFQVLPTVWPDPSTIRKPFTAAFSTTACIGPPMQGTVGSVSLVEMFGRSQWTRVMSA